MRFPKKMLVAGMFVLFAATLSMQSYVVAGDSTTATDQTKVGTGDKKHKQVKKTVGKKDRKKHKAAETSTPQNKTT